MRPSVPILRAGTRVPAIPERGLSLQGPRDGKVPAAGPAWLRGVLVVDAPDTVEAVEAWLRATFITMVNESSAKTVQRSLLGEGGLWVDPARGRRQPDGKVAPLVVHFQLDLSELLGGPFKGAWFVHASAREHTSRVLRLAVDKALVQEPLASLYPDGLPQRTPVDSLALAFATLAVGQPERAAVVFDEALRDETNRADIDRGALFHAARAASLAAKAAAPAARPAFVQRALGWLKEDVERRRRRLQEVLAADVSAEVAGPLPQLRAQRLERLRAAFVAHARHARDVEPDLATIRESEFAGIFGGTT